MILVTGASGNVGGAVLNELLNLGAPVRAMYRSESDASKPPAGAERVIADFSDRGSLDRALEGIERIFLVCSPIPQLVQLQRQNPVQIWQPLIDGRVLRHRHKRRSGSNHEPGG